MGSRQYPKEPRAAGSELAQLPKVLARAEDGFLQEIFGIGLASSAQAQGRAI